MAICKSGIEGSIKISYAQDVLVGASGLVMSTNSTSEIYLNQAGQTSRRIADVVNTLNKKFGSNIGSVKFDDSGQKYIYIRPSEDFIDQKYEEALDLEDARRQQIAEAERAGLTEQEYLDVLLAKKTKAEEFKATVEQIAEAKTWFDNSPLSKVINFNQAFSVVNSNAVGQWTKYGITLFHGADYSDLYHESWHGFSQLYLTKEQKTALYNEARKVLGSDLTDFEVEEILAEDFREYVLSGSKKVLNQRAERNTIFRKIYNFLKKLFGGVSAREAIDKGMALDVVREMYEKLYTGNIFDLKPSIDNIQFSKLNKGLTSIADNKATLNFEQSMAIVETIDYFIAEVIDKNNIPVTALFTSEKALEQAYNIAFESLKTVRDKITTVKDSITSEIQVAALQEKIDALTFAIDNYGDIKQASKRGATGTIAYHKKTSKFLDFTVTAKSLEDILEIDPADVKDYSQLFDRSGTEGSMLDYADPSVLYMLRSVPQKQTNYFGLPKLYNYTEVFKRIARAVSGKKLTMNEMYQIMSSSKDEVLKKIAVKLGDPSFFNANSQRFDLWTKFYQTYNRYLIPILEFIHEQEADGTYKNKLGAAVGIPKAIRNTWKRTFSQGKDIQDNQNPYAKRTSSGVILDMEKLKQDFPKITVDNAFDYLKAIGIFFDDTQEVRREVRKLTPRIADYIKPALEAIDQKDSKQEDYLGMMDPVALLNTGRKDVFIDGKPVESNASLVNEFVDIYRRTSEKVIFGTVLNAENKPQNEYSLNNSLTEIVGSLNDVTKSYQEIVSQPHMRSWDITKNPYAKRSIILNSLFDLDLTSETFGSRRPGASLLLNNFNGVKTITGDESTGIATTDLDPYSKFVMDMNSFLSSGIMELMRHASKSTAYSVKLSGKLLTGENAQNPYLYVDINKFGNNDPRGNRVAVDLIKQHLAAELERALIVRNENINISGYSEKAKDLTLFAPILEKEAVDQLLGLDYTQDLLDQILANESLNASIEKSLAKYLADQTSKNLEIYQKHSYESKGLRNLDNVSEQSAVRAYTANAFIHNLEMMSLFYGDAALYNHAKDDFHKRNAGIASTGDQHVSDDSAIRHVNDIGFKYAERLAAKEGFTVEPFSTVLNTAVIEDVVVDLEKDQPELWQEYLNAYQKEGISLDSLEEYKKTNAADGQGYITFDFYMASRKLLGKWSPKQQELYNKIVSNLPVSSEEVAKTFPPLKYQYFGPIVTEKLNVYAFHKFSLFPLVPTVIKGTNLEKLHNQMVRQNIHYSTFKSGSKLADGTPPKQVFNESFEFNEGELNSYKVHLQYLKDQVNISDEFKGSVRFSTQLRKLVLQYLYENGKPVSPKAQELVEQYEKDIVTHIEKKLQEVYSDVGISKVGDSYSLEDRSKMVSYLKERLSKRDVPEHIVDYVDTTINDKISNNLELSLNSNEIEKALYSIVANDVIKGKFNGESLVQVSGVGFEKSGNEQESKLKFYTQVGGITQPMEVKIALQGSFNELLKLNHSDGESIKTIERLNEMIKNTAFRALHRELLQMVAVRIPVQGHNSMEFMEVAEFLPVESGISIVLPHQITTKSGGDFDIDKLTVMMPKFKVKDNVVEHNISEDSIEGLENSIIQDIISILEIPENFVNLIRPNGTDIVKPIADDPTVIELNKKFSWTNGATKILETGYNLYKHESNAVGKKTLGIGAVNNTNNVTYNRTGFTFSEKLEYKGATIPATIFLPHNKNEEGLTTLSGLKTVDNVSIGDIISQLMNGWVDVEKDAWIFNVQGNDIVGPVLLFMIEAGVSYENAVKFLSNPLVKEFSEKIKLYSSPFNPNFKTNRFEVERSVEFEILKSNQKFQKLLGNKIKDQGEDFNFSEKQLNDLLYNKADKETQEFAFLHFLQLKDMASVTRRLNMSANFDTVTFNNSISLETQLSKKLTSAKFTIYGELDNSINSYYNAPILKAFAEASSSQIDAWNFFPIKNSEAVKQRLSLLRLYRRDDIEKATNTVLSQLYLRIYQEALLSADYQAKEYKTLPIKKAVLDSGAFVKDGVLYVDFETIKSELIRNKVNSNNQTFGRAPINANAFSFKTQDGQYNLDQYYNFVLEREYLRSITPQTEGQTKEAYEAKLRDKALYNTNNLWFMFSSSPEAKSYAGVFSTLIERYPDLLLRYGVLKDLQVDRSNGVDRLKLSSRITESEVLNSYHENLKDLSDPSITKVSDPVANINISNFFAKFGTFAFLQNGTMPGLFNLSKIAPSDQYTSLMENHFSNIDKLEAYLSGKLRDIIVQNDPESKIYTINNKLGVNNYLSNNYPTITKRDVNKVLAEFNILTEEIEGAKITKDSGNVLMIETAQKSPGLKRLNNVILLPAPSETSVEEFKGLVQEAMQRISYLINDGSIVKIDSSFYTTKFEGYPEHKKEFFRAFENTFGKAIPGSEKFFREEQKLTQEVTDADVLEAINRC